MRNLERLQKQNFIKKASLLFLLFFISSCRFEGKYKKINLSTTGFSPSYSMYTGGGTITINGDGFKEGQKVSIGGSSCTNVTIKSENELTCTIPAHSGGVVDITVSYPSGYSKTLPGFTYYNALSISNISPSSSFLLGGKTITITGDGFQPGMTITINGTSCASVNIVSVTQANCVNPMKTSPGLVDVVLTNTNTATVTATNGFEYKTDQFETVSLFSGNLTLYGSNNGAAGTAKFYNPTSLVLYNDDFYIADTKNNVIRKMNKTTGVVSTFAGIMGSSGSTDGSVSTAKFNQPMGLVVLANNMYVTDSLNCTIRKINMLTGTVSTLAGIAGNCANADNAVGLSATFDYPSGIDTDGTDLFISASWNGAGHFIKKISLSGSNAVTTLFSPVYSVAGVTYSSGYIYYTFGDLSNSQSKVIRLDLSNLTTSLIAGGSNTFTIADGVGSGAKFNYPGGMAIDGNNLYVADALNHAIRKIDLTTNTVTTVAGLNNAGTGISGNLDGPTTSATLSYPVSLYLYNSGGTKELYFLSYGYHNIRKLDLNTNQVSTVAGKVGQ